jgi:hypothetical protein
MTTPSAPVPEVLEASKQLVGDVVELQALRDQARYKAEELRQKYLLHLPGDPYPDWGDDFVEEVLRHLQSLRINPFTGKVN